MIFLSILGIIIANLSLLILITNFNYLYFFVMILLNDFSVLVLGIIGYENYDKWKNNRENIKSKARK